MISREIIISDNYFVIVRFVVIAQRTIFLLHTFPYFSASSATSSFHDRPSIVTNIRIPRETFSKTARVYGKLPRALIYNAVKRCIWPARLFNTIFLPEQSVFFI